MLEKISEDCEWKERVFGTSLAMGILLINLKQKDDKYRHKSLDKKFLSGL